jgi:translation initiation factor IF-1
VKKKKQQNKGGNHRRRPRPREARKEDCIYFDGVVTESLPGVQFRVKVKRLTKDKNTGEDIELEPIHLVCHLKTKLIKRRVSIIKGDNVVVEVNPIDMYFDEENNILKGTIIERH